MRESRVSDRVGLYRAFPQPPADFDPRKAPDAVLARYGLPRRPHPEREREIAPIWDRVFERPITYVKADLALDPVMSDRNPLAFDSVQPDRDPLSFEGGRWAGGVIRNGSPFRWVFAEWTVPWVSTEKHFWEDRYALAFWVGIDGYSNDQVLQAGVAVKVETEWIHSWGLIPYIWPRTKVTWWAWTEWWTQQHKDPSVEIKNFPVGPGDLVGVIVCAPEPGSASVFMRNGTTNLATSVAITAPAGYTSQGAEAEWILEPKGKLARFAPLTFNDCRSGSQARLAHHGDAFAMDLVGADAEIAPPTSVVVNWE